MIRDANLNHPAHASPTNAEHQQKADKDEKSSSDDDSILESFYTASSKPRQPSSLTAVHSSEKPEHIDEDQEDDKDEDENGYFTSKSDASSSYETPPLTREHSTPALTAESPNVETAEEARQTPPSLELASYEQEEENEDIGSLLTLLRIMGRATSGRKSAGQGLTERYMQAAGIPQPQPTPSTQIAEDEDWELVHAGDAEEEWELVEGADIEDDWDMVPEAERFQRREEAKSFNQRMREYFLSEKGKRESEGQGQGKGKGKGKEEKQGSGAGEGEKN